jgi:hypothetical protein
MYPFYFSTFARQVVNDKDGAWVGGVTTILNNESSLTHFWYRLFFVKKVRGVPSLPGTISLAHT